MKDFFKVVDIGSVYGHIQSFAPVDTQIVDTQQATGRILAEAVQAGCYPVLPEEQVRFKMEANESYAFVLDSATGQVWSAGFVYNPQFNSVVFPFDPDFHAIKTAHETE